tara:strand:- start:277 stop:753 length:477 start_codon:yes stop_codon:yes gene_type:complete
MKKIILLYLSLLLVGCGGSDGDENNNNNNIDPNDPIIGVWEIISEERYVFENDTGYGRACLNESDPELPSQFRVYSNGKADLYTYECSGGDSPSNPVQTEELFSLDGNWEQIGGDGSYLFYDPTDEVPNDEIFYCEFNNDNSQLTHDTGEVIQIWQRQ